MWNTYLSKNTDHIHVIINIDIIFWLDLASFICFVSYTINYLYMSILFRCWIVHFKISQNNELQKNTIYFITTYN